MNSDVTVAASTERPKVLILAFSLLAGDSRVLRQVRSLSQHFEVTSAAFGPSPISAVEHVELEELPPYRRGRFARLSYIVRFLFRRFPSLTQQNARNSAAADRLGEREWDVILANDVESLPLAFRLRSRHGVLADVHEYATRQNEHSRVWRWVFAPYYRWLVRFRLSRANAVTTVSQGIANAYSAEFGILAEVVTNASAMQNLSPVAPSRPIRLVHSGAVAPQRRLEIMIDAVRLSAADVTLDFFLINDGSPYFAMLKARAEGEPRIRFNPPVPSEDLVATLNNFDVGLSVFPPTTFNLAWCLPNKFFDFVQARLGVIVGPSPEMERVVKATGIGVVLPDFSAESLSRQLDELSLDRVGEWKSASHRNAAGLSSEPQVRIWRDIIDKLVSARG